MPEDPAIRPEPVGFRAPGPPWPVVVAALLASVAGLALLVAGDNAITRADASAIEWTAQHRPAWLVDVARAVTLLGHGVILAAILIVICVGLAWRGVLPPRAALLPPLALAIGGGLNPLLKAIVDRPRPPAELRVTTELSRGFPSGHAAQSASAWIALALVLWLWARPHRRWPSLILVVLALAIGITRVILAVHSPTDVLAGWAWGGAVALAVVGAAAYAERRSAMAGARSVPPSGGDPASPPAPARSSASER
ncbi:MAG: phosphatase PAP2 family protein [Patulibacter sp.]|nr:phosphatase PAP2 family protein [Patulibacter sp.]